MSGYYMANQFLSTTQVYITDNLDTNANNFESVLRNNLNMIVLALNTKDSGYYPQEEILTGQLFYPNYTSVISSSSAPQQYRPIYRKVIDTGTLPNTGTSTTAHGITFLPVAGNTTFRVVNIRGAATDPAGRVMISLPYSSPTLNQNISVYADQTNVYITTGINMAAYTDSHICVEWIKL